MVDELLEILDTQPEYSCFLMDGQSVIIEDYLEFRPENKEKIEDYRADHGKTFGKKQFQKGNRGRTVHFGTFGI